MGDDDKRRGEQSFRFLRSVPAALEQITACRPFE
jgi:hypothetical protein